MSLVNSSLLGSPVSSSSGTVLPAGTRIHACGTISLLTTPPTLVEGYNILSVAAVTGQNAMAQVTMSVAASSTKYIVLVCPRFYFDSATSAFAQFGWSISDNGFPAITTTQFIIASVGPNAYARTDVLSFAVIDPES